jgi:hypothetical protein
VFAAQATAGATTANDKTTYRYSAGFPVDMIMQLYLAGSSNNAMVADRLRGYTTTTTVNTPYLVTSATAAEVAGSNWQLDNMLGVTLASTAGASTPTSALMFRRAPGVFDVVCGTANANGGWTSSHNLGTTPELLIFKPRSSVAAGTWCVYHSATGVSKYNNLDSAAFSTASNVWSVSSTSASFADGYFSPSYTYVAYIFASKAGISKCGSYTGNGGTADSAGTSQTINCGFSAGARFVMIKCTSHAGDWLVWDSARGIVAGNDPHLSLNTTVAEVTTDDAVDPDNSGFTVNQLAVSGGLPTSGNLNVTDRTYIYLAIA